ncbi:uncharacterized protein LOC117651143 [Thrips palmi]|uniref:Uncharacterized protein LOC117651143 n=1 Tax=Thrips palmi TaxID=161013 RepID=A0A6P9A209_THRPL|nr:uncharacterized protein LOC117651143 [Thrips palmi]
MAMAVVLCLVGLCLAGDLVRAVRLIEENGYRGMSHYYHLGDGSHAYHFNTETSSSLYFRCVFYDKLNCRGRAIMRFGGAFRHSNPHNHPPDRDLVSKRHFRENVLDECRDAKYVSYQQILDKARSDRRYHRRVRCTMTMRRLRNAMYKARMDSFPQIPDTLSEVTQLLLQRRWAKISSTVDGDDNLYAGSITALDGSHNVVFMSRRMRDFAGRISILQSDGTFRARPIVPPTSQVFVLVTPWQNAVIPIGWVLMEKRTYSAYRAVIHLLKRLCPDLQPGVIVTDWEWPQQRAWQEAFPNARVQGCLWHLCRAYVRKVAQLGLLKFRQSLPDMFDIIRKVCGIALLPRRFFLVGLGLLRAEALQTDVLIAYLLRPFFTYVETKWITNGRRRYWMNLYNSMHRTNNCCESHNKQLRTAVGAYRPNIYAFIAALARLEHNAYLNVDLMDMGGVARRSRRWQAVFADAQIKNLCNEFDNDVFRNRNVTVQNFLNQAADLFYSAYRYHLDRAGR